MKLHARNLTPHIRAQHGDTRPVLLTLAGLHIAMTTSEARHLADALHDLADTLEEKQP